MDASRAAEAIRSIGRVAAGAGDLDVLVDTSLPLLRDLAGASSAAIHLPEGTATAVVATAGAPLDHALLDPSPTATVPEGWRAAGVAEVACHPLTPTEGWLVLAWTAAAPSQGRQGSDATGSADWLDAAATVLGATIEGLSTRAELADLAQRVDNAQMLAHMGDYDWHIASDTNRWSDQLYRIYGHEPQSFNASYERFLSSLHPDDRERVKAVHAHAYASGEPWEIVERIIRPDGEVRYLATNGEVVMDADGTPVRMRGTCVDITARVLAEQEGERSAARFRALVESSPEAILVMDDRGRFTHANARAHELLRGDPEGRRVTEVLGAHAAPDAIRPPTPPGQVQDRQGVDGEAVQATALDGTPLHLDTTIAVLGDEDEARFAVFLDDAGPRLEREALAMRMREAQVRRRHAMEINDNVVQGLAAAVYALQRGRAEAARSYLDGTLQAARRMMDDLLEPLEGEDLQPGDLVRSHASAATATLVPDDAPRGRSPGDPGVERPRAEDRGQPSRVLVVDDSADMRLLVGTLLGDLHGFAVVGEAADGQEAVAKAVDLQPDVIVLDLAMPVLDGLQALPLLREVLPHASIVVLSGFDGAAMAEKAMAAGADGYLEKGRAFEDLVDALHAAVAARQR